MRRVRSIALAAAALLGACGGTAEGAAPVPTTTTVAPAPSTTAPDTTRPTRAPRDPNRPATRTPVSRPSSNQSPGSVGSGSGSGGRRRPGSSTTAAANLIGPLDLVITLPDHADRPARLFVPARRAGTRVPLLVALHGSSSDADTLAGYTDLDALADAAGWAVLWPRGQRVDGVRSWNAGTCCAPASEAGIDDLGYLSALLDDVLAADPVDPARVVVVGHSNGAFMAHTVACRLADRVLAAVAVAGGLATGCEPDRPVSVLAIHGTTDGSVDYSLGAAAAWRWQDLDGCTAMATADNGTVRTESWNDCDGDTSVRLVTLPGAPHAWPGGPTPTVEGFDAGEVLLAWAASLPARTG